MLLSLEALLASCEEEEEDDVDGGPGTACNDGKDIDEVPRMLRVAGPVGMEKAKVPGRDTESKSSRA